ncbi:hypothetical protein HMI54_008342 [Coelomomyces lativittatus]|nr:hypothetical protein HMI55_002808 [Coelomomyces lativittatus]KAJ1503183.1 hypothetical protein HMI54_008342 [Coelomomyces lativittatus]
MTLSIYIYFFFFVSLSFYLDPFFIHRTKLARQLPVYVNKKCQHKVTSIQRIEGDIENLAKRLKEVLPEKCEITVKPQRRRIEVKWDHSQVIRDYLTQLGF